MSESPDAGAVTDRLRFDDGGGVPEEARGGHFRKNRLPSSGVRVEAASYNGSPRRNNCQFVFYFSGTTRWTALFRDREAIRATA